jgi:hypothetical protein
MMKGTPSQGVQAALEAKHESQPPLNKEMDPLVLQLHGTESAQEPD